MGSVPSQSQLTTAPENAGGIVTASTRSGSAQIARTFSCRALSLHGVFRRMLMPSEAETASRAGTAAEKTNEVPLMRW